MPQGVRDQRHRGEGEHSQAHRGHRQDAGEGRAQGGAAQPRRRERRRRQPPGTMIFSAFVISLGIDMRMQHRHGLMKHGQDGFDLDVL